MSFTFAIKFDHKRCHIYRYLGRGYLSRNFGNHKVTCKFNLPELDSGAQILRATYGKCYYLPQIELLGKTFDDPFVQDYMKRCPFDIINDNNQPRYVAKQADKTRTFSIEEVLAITMKRALYRMSIRAGWELDAQIQAQASTSSSKDLETKLKSHKKEVAVVVVVPNTFGEAQRRAMMVAAGLAGMNVTHIVSQAMSVAYFFNTANPAPTETGSILDSITLNTKKESRLSQDGNFLFFHFGKSSLDISVIMHNETKKLVEIKLATGDSMFGGKDFIHRLMEGAPKKFTVKGSREFQRACHLLNHDELAFVPAPYKRNYFYWLDRGAHEFKAWEVKLFKEYSDSYPSKLGEPWKLTTEQREEAYNLEKAELEKASYRLTRQMYERKCADLLKRVKQLLAEAISEAGIAPSDYQSVQMYGKYCRLPGVLDIVREQLPDTLISFDDNTSLDYVVENNIEYLGEFWERRILRPGKDFSMFHLYEPNYDLMGAAWLSSVLNCGVPVYRSICLRDKKNRIPEFLIPYKNLRLINKSQVAKLVPSL